MAITIYYDDDGEQGIFADTVYEKKRPTHSHLLGPDGEPLMYEQRRIGFDLTPKKARTR